MAIGGKRGGLKLGYRKGKKGGVWIAKAVGAQRRQEITLGSAADDDDDKPGALTFKAAIAAALEWGTRQRARLYSENEPTRPTIASAVEGYIAARQQRDTRRGADARSRLTKHVLSDKKFSQLRLEDLTVKALRAWANRKGAPLVPATMNRLQNDLRAALNAAIEMHGRELPHSTKQEVATGLRSRRDAEHARRIVLIDAEVRTLIAAAECVDADLGALVLVLASTGCRFSQAAALTVGDVQIDAQRIMVSPSRKGGGTKIRPPIAFPIGPDVVTALKPLIAGRAEHETLLERWISRQVGPIAWERVRRGPWRASSEMTRGWAKALKSTRIRIEIPPYALRHSSIARCLRAGVPVRIVAALHDTSSAMIEKHYAAYILDVTDDLARRAITPLVSPPVTQLSAVAS